MGKRKQFIHKCDESVLVFPLYSTLLLLLLLLLLLISQYLNVPNIVIFLLVNYYFPS